MLSSDEEFLSLDNTSLLLSIKKKKGGGGGREGIYQINTEKGQLDEYVCFMN